MHMVTGDTTVPTTGHSRVTLTYADGQPQPSSGVGGAEDLSGTRYLPFDESDHHPTGKAMSLSGCGSKLTKWVLGMGAGRKGTGTGPSVNHTQAPEEHQNQAVAAYQQIHRYVNILKTRCVLVEYEVWSLV